MRLNNSEKIRAYNKLKQAVKNDEFIPYFQPIIDLTSGAITGVEALARWNDPERGIVGPYAFIELAEDTGLIDAIGLSIFKKSLRWYQCNQHQLPSTFCIHVNISIRQLMSSNFVEEIKQLMNDVGYSHRNLCFEFTESIYMESKQVIDNLVGLRELGISFAIDDFGTGYSSFSYLRDLDFSSLKIDKSFVSDDNVEILKAMIKVGRSLGCEVIAEGVETAEQCALLRKLKCPMVQGYLFSKPLPEEEFTEFMLHNNEQSMLSLC
ncbi:putative bifunctional diguanylate cyclase/phosphodiesterase [Vibrio taketomensis]|nr:EAL domain-containing protein [Vibrio taketomensis]